LDEITKFNAHQIFLLYGIVSLTTALHYTSIAKLVSCKYSVLTNYDNRPFCLWSFLFLLTCALWRCSL